MNNNALIKISAPIVHHMEDALGHNAHTASFVMGNSGLSFGKRQRDVARNSDATDTFSIIRMFNGDPKT